MGKKSKNKSSQPNPLLSAPLSFSNEFEGLESFEELPSCTFMKLNRHGRIRREVWKDGKILKVKNKKNKNNNKEKSKERKVNTQTATTVAEKKPPKKKSKTNQTATTVTEKNLPEKQPEMNDGEEVESSAEPPQKKRKKRKKKSDENKPNKKPRYDSASVSGAAEKSGKKVDVSEWESIFAPPEVLEALSELGFSTPTEIQRLVLPAAIKGRMDIVGAAETGSGKTLAFGIPIIHGILSDRAREANEKRNDIDSGVENSDEEMTEEAEDRGSEDEGDSEADLQNVKGIDLQNVEEIGFGPFSNSDEEGGMSDSESENEDDNGLLDNEGDLSDGDVEDAQKFDGEDMNEAESEGEYGEETEFDDSKLGCVKVIEDVEFDFLNEKPKGTASSKPLRALIVTPTRELAIQVKNHLAAVLVHTDIKIAVIVGGLASEKQMRILDKGPEIVVGTPGRLWELIESGNSHLGQVENISYLAIDETDRMVEQGHFEELQKLLEFINSNENTKPKRQNFVFSATLTLVHKAPKRLKMKGKAQKMTSELKIKQLAKMIGLKAKPKIVDVTRAFGTAESLTESRINCDKSEKDFYLYYFLKQYPGRTLVFCNSIDCVRRLQNLFTLLQCSPMSLHASMHQKQRLKSLEKFSSSSKALLLATDVAARGLDIPNIQHVIHYQTPRTAETYIHRSGRTARATQEGLSVLFVDSSEVSKYRQLCNTLNRATDLPPFPVDLMIMEQVKSRIDFARKLESMEHSQRKSKANENWLQRAAKEAELLIDEEEEYDDELSYQKSTKAKQEKQQVKAMRASLMKMLSVPLFCSSFSGKYPTQSGSLIMPLSKDVEEGGGTKAGNEALSLVKKESAAFSKLVKTVKPREPRKKKVNKKKFKGFEKRKLKLQKEKEKMEKSMKEQDD